MIKDKLRNKKHFKRLFEQKLIEVRQPWTENGWEQCIV